MTMYSRLNTTLLTQAYKRGQYKGDAPADPTRRSRNHVRIVRRPDSLALRMYSTDIITAYPDGRISFDMRGWGDSITTRQNLNDALGRFCPFGLRLVSRSVFSESQSCLVNTDLERTYVYYDGIEFNNEGEIISEKRPFAARRVDKSESKEFMDGIKESGFKALFPLLYATATPIKGFDSRTGARLRSMLTQECHANEWPDLISMRKFTERLDYDPVSCTRVYRPVEIGNAKSCWSAIMARAKYDLSRVVTSTTTELIGDTTPKFFPASTPRKPV
jgi:hypothetical protein